MLFNSQLIHHLLDYFGYLHKQPRGRVRVSALSSLEIIVDELVALFPELPVPSAK